VARYLDRLTASKGKAAQMRDQRSEEPAGPADEFDLARAQEYGLLSTLLLGSPDRPLLARLALLRGDASRLGLAHAALGSAAAHTDAASVAREYHALFTGLGRGELLPYASYYLTGFLHGRPLANLRQTLRRIGVERFEGHSEPEDHAGTLLEIMAGLAGGTIPAPPGTDHEIFDEHLAPWIARFFADLEKAECANFYVSVGAYGRTFMEIEMQCFQLPR
jgi:TorA maturation chaperone TorD